MNLLFEPSIETIFGSTSAKTIRLFISSQLVDFTVYVPDNDGHALSTAKFPRPPYTYKLPTYQWFYQTNYMENTINLIE